MNTEDQRIRQFAYEIWEAEGRPEGQDARHWEMARKLAESQTLEQRPPSPPPRRVSKPKEVSLSSAVQKAKPAAAKKPKSPGKTTAAKAPKAQPQVD